MPPPADPGRRPTTGVARVALALAATLALASLAPVAAGAARPGRGRQGAVPGRTTRLPPGSTTDLTYCRDGGQRLELTVFEPPRAETAAPVVVQVHGGGWEVGHRIRTAAASATVRGLLRAGFVVASVEYRLAPAFRWPAQMEDVACAVRYVRAHAGLLRVDPDRLGAWGTSAGGQLVSLLGTDGGEPAWSNGQWPGRSAVPEAVVDGYGPVDLRAPGWGRYLRELLATVFGTDPAVLAGASPVDHVAPGDPPFLVLQGTADRLVPPSQSIRFVEALRAAGDQARLVLVRGGEHGLATPGEIPSARWLSAATVAFFRRTLAPAEAGRRR